MNDFGRELNHTVSKTVVYPPDSIKVLIGFCRDDDAFPSLSPRTQEVYGLDLDRIAKPDAWGFFTRQTFDAARCSESAGCTANTPGMANQMLTVGRTLFSWAIPLGYVNSNPFQHLGPLDIPDRGHVPWPRWALDVVLASAPEDLRRMVRLAAMTCQRVIDLIRIGPIRRESLHGRGAGIWCRPKKTRRRRKSVFIPLRTADALELDRWAEAPIAFMNTRWKAARAYHNKELY